MVGDGDAGADGGLETDEESVPETEPNDESITGMFDELETHTVLQIKRMLHLWSDVAAAKRNEQRLQRIAAAQLRAKLASPRATPALPSKPPPAKPQPCPQPILLDVAADGVAGELQADLRSRLDKLGLSEWASVFAASSIYSMADVLHYTSGKQLRDELERSGAIRVPMHVCNRIYAKKPSPPAQSSPVVDADDVVAAGFETSPLATDLPLVDALLQRVGVSERDALVLNALELIGVSPITGSGGDVDDRNAEKLEVGLEEAGLVVANLSGHRGTARAARMALSRALKAASAPSGSDNPAAAGICAKPAARLGAVPSQPMGPHLGMQSDLSSMISSLSNASHDSRPTTLQEDCGMARVSALAHDPAACGALEQLVATVKTGDDLATATAVREAQEMFPVLAQVLHHETLKFPTGAASLPALSGAAPVSGAVARELVKAVKQVQSAAPLAIARAIIFPDASARLSQGACEDIMQLAWLGKLISADHTASFNIGMALDDRKAKTLLGGSKGASAEASQEWMLHVYPTIVLSLEMSHPHDSSASQIASRIGALALGNGSTATLVEGQTEVLVPFMRAYLEAWEAFARGGDYPSCAAVWAKTSATNTSVAAWLTSASLRSRQSSQITDLQAQNQELKASQAKLLGRLEKLEKRPPTTKVQQQPPSDKLLIDEAEPTLTNKQKRTEKWKADCARRDAENAAKAAAASALEPPPGGPPATAPPQTGQLTTQTRLKVPA